ncbi:MAG: FAD-dependent oxidoreductase [Candidatus Wolfebacteria bacterium]|nr:FAD-dependent oxidoreductase [Candidatus Wolfebacteria bacterium]
MEKYQYLIIGGGVAGFTAAETLRQKDAGSSIAVINSEPYALYSRVMLSKPDFFLGKIPFDKIWMRGQDWYEKNNITFFGGKTAASLDPNNKIVKLSDGLELGYEKLLIATGVCARKWGISGSEKEGVYYLRTIDDGKKIMEAIKTAKRAVAIGGGFISFEMADLFALAKIETSVVIRENYFWEPTLDEASGKMIEKVLTNNGVKIINNAEVQEVIGAEKVEGIVLKDGRKIECDMVICGIGVACDLNWFASSGIKTNRGILANEYLQTNLPDVWAAGDIAEYNDLLLEENIQLGNWVNAHEQGRIAGLNMAGVHEPFKFVSFYTTQGMGISVAFVGDVRLGEDRIIIKRGSPEINSYARIIIVGKELVGATLINRTSELSVIAKLIENNIDVSQKYKELENPNFDLKNLLVVETKVN